MNNSSKPFRQSALLSIKFPLLLLPSTECKCNSAIWHSHLHHAPLHLLSQSLDTLPPHMCLYWHLDHSAHIFRHLCLPVRNQRWLLPSTFLVNTRRQKHSLTSANYTCLPDHRSFMTNKQRSFGSYCLCSLAQHRFGGTLSHNKFTKEKTYTNRQGTF